MYNQFQFISTRIGLLNSSTPYTTITNSCIRKLHSTSIMSYTSKLLSNSFKLPYVADYTQTSGATDLIHTITQKQCKYSFYDKSTWPDDPLQLFVECYIQAEANYYKHNSCEYCNTLHSDTHHPTSICTSTCMPNTMQIATVSSDGQPHLRTVLMKGCDSRGIIFFSNYDSAKGIELRQNNKISCLFYLKSLEKQIRVEGTIEYLSGIESDIYFHERPIPSQLGAGVSKQSSILKSRSELESTYLRHVHNIAQQIELNNNNAYDLHTDTNHAAFDTTSKANEYIGKNESAQTAMGDDYKSALGTLSSYGTDDKKLHQLRGLVKRPKFWGGYLIRPHTFELYV